MPDRIESGASAGTPTTEGPAPREWSAEHERSLRLWITLARCYSTYSRAITCKISEYGLTAPQFGVLEERSPEDRRVVQGMLTSKGRELISGVFPGHVDFIEKLSGHLAPDEQDELRSLLKKFGTAIAKEELGKSEA